MLKFFIELALKIIGTIVVPLVVCFISNKSFKNNKFNITVSNPSNRYNSFRHFSRSDMEIISLVIISLLLTYAYVIYMVFNQKFYHHLTNFLIVYIITLLTTSCLIKYIIKDTTFSTFELSDTKYYIIGNRDQDDFYICQTHSELTSPSKQKKYIKIKKNKVVNFKTEHISLSNFKFSSIPLTILKFICLKIINAINKHKKTDSH